MTGYQRRLVRDYLVALAVAAAFMPLLVVGLGAPPLAAFVGSIGLFSVIALFSAVRKAPGDGARLKDQAKSGALAAVAAEAEPALERLDRFVEVMPKNLTRDRVQAIASDARKLLEHVRTEPERLMAVQRAFTYYLPRTADLAEGYQALRLRDIRSPERLAAIEDVIAKLQGAFEHFQDQLDEQDLRVLDAEVKLVRDSIAEDTGS